MEYANYVSYYVGLFTIQITLATIIAAGILAWYQLTEKQVPKRSLSKVIKPWTLTIYFLLSIFMVIATGILAWSLLGDHDILPQDTAVEPAVTFLAILLTITLVGYFFYILWRTRKLIDIKSYLQKISDDMDYAQLNDFLFHKYSYKPFGYIGLAWVGDKKTEKEKDDEKKQKEKAEEDVRTWEDRYKKTEGTQDPVQPILDYCRANAISASADVERVGLPLLAEILGKAVASKEHSNEYIEKYLADITDDMSEVLGNSSIIIKKRFIDVIFSVALEYCNDEKYETMIPAAKNIHTFARGREESLKIYAVLKLEQLVEAFKKKTSDTKDWRDVYLPLEGLILVGARIGEDYYHNVNELAPVSIVENNNSEVDDFPGVLSDFMYRMSDLHRNYPDAVPVIYFDSLYVVSLALQSAMARSSAFKQDLGLTRTKYQQIVTSWDFTLYDHIRTAITAENEDLLSSAIYNFMKLLDNMSNLKMYDEMLDSIDTLVVLGARIATSVWAKNRDTYGGISILDEIVSRIVAYPNQDALLERKSSIERGMFDIQFKDGYSNFMASIGW